MIFRSGNASGLIRADTAGGKTLVIPEWRSFSLEFTNPLKLCKGWLRLMVSTTVLQQRWECWTVVLAFVVSTRDEFFAH